MLILIKLLIVDDELIIRKGIKTSIDWETYGIEIHEASNGQEALEKAPNIKPHIVMTDIRMPVMDGLKLCEKLQSKGIDAKIVILSGYDDFAYAQKAIKYGVEDYLLKPIGAPELIKVIRKIKQKILLEDKTMKKINDESKLIEDNLDLIRSGFIHKLLNDEFNDIDFIVERAKQLDISFIGPQYRIMLLDIDNYFFIIEDMHYREVLEFRKSFIEIAQHEFNSTGNVFDSQFDFFIVLVNLKKYDDIETYIKDVKKSIVHRFETSITISISKPCQEICELSKTYKEARIALKQKAHMGKNRMIYYDDECSMEQLRPLIYPSQEEGNLLEYLRLMKEDKVIKSIDSIFVPLKDIRVNLTTIYGVIVRLMTMIMNLAEDMGVSPNKLPLDRFRLHEEVKKYKTFDDSIYWLKEVVVEIIALIQNSKSESYNSIIVSALNYIDENYHHTINLKDIASTVYVSPNYFCKIFKQEMNENFTEWLNKYRIEKAKYLMIGKPHLKTYDIARRVGFNDYKYFSNIFKKYTGHTSREYKNKYAKFTMMPKEKM